jgi:alpha-tubulin suppressor-like RCC1 family protein
MKHWLTAFAAGLALLLIMLIAAHRHPALGIRMGKPLRPARVRPQLVNAENMAWLLAPDGSLWGWGDPTSFFWSSGVRPATTLLPQRIGSDNNWVSVAASINTALALEDDGSLWIWGWHCQFSLGRRVNLLPTRVGAETNWAQVAVGAAHYLALKSDGSLWSWGQNRVGQLGDGTTKPRTYPQRIGTNSDWAKIAANGYETSVALKSNHTLWVWGQMGLTNRLEPTQFSAETHWLAVAAGAARVLALKSDGTVWVQTFSGEALEQVGRDADWKEIYPALNTFFLRKRDGSWWTWGRVTAGQLYFQDCPQLCPLSFEPWAFAPGGNTHLLLTEDGVLWSWGARLGSPPGSALAKAASFFAPVIRQFPALGQLFEPKIDQQPYRLWELPEGMRGRPGNVPSKGSVLEK